MEVSTPDVPDKTNNENKCVECGFLVCECGCRSENFYILFQIYCKNFISYSFFYFSVGFFFLSLIVSRNFVARENKLFDVCL